MIGKQEGEDGDGSTEDQLKEMLKPIKRELMRTCIRAVTGWRGKGLASTDIAYVGSAH